MGRCSFTEDEGKRIPRCSNRKGKASCSSLHLDSRLRVGTLMESFARIKCRSVHKKISSLKENQTMGIQSYHMF